MTSIELRTGDADGQPRLYPATADDETGEVSALDVQARRQGAIPEELKSRFARSERNSAAPAQLTRQGSKSCPKSS